MTEPLAYDLFCGAGGASLGIVRAGYRVKGFDNWNVAIQTHIANGMPAKCVDLSKFRFSKSRRGKIDLLWGSPPCQPFSNSVHQWGRWDPRDGFPHYLRALRRLMPRVAILENVAGLASKRHAAYLAKIVVSIEKLGYVVEWKVLDLSDYRIPQARKRLIIIARLDGDPVWPKINHEKITVMDRLLTDGIDNPVGHRVVYAKNPTTTGGFAGALLFNGRGRPIDLHQPSRTIYASSGNHVHWFDTLHVAERYFAELKRDGIAAKREGFVRGARRLTVPQMARLQSFPKDFTFCGPTSLQVRQIGNAIPPRMAHLLVKHNAA